MLLTNQPTMEAAYGAARAFWQALRDRYGELTYFCWLELTAAGLPHYHAMLTNPPPGFFSRSNKAWLEEQWGNRFVKLAWRDAEWFARAAGAYAGSYVKKMGHKAYQQSYEEVPRELRTFMCNRLDHPSEVLALHESRWQTTLVDREWTGSSNVPVEPYIRLDVQLRHVCAPGGLAYVTKRQHESGRHRQVQQPRPVPACRGHVSSVASNKRQLGANQAVQGRRLSDLIPRRNRLASRFLEDRFTRADHPSNLLGRHPAQHEAPGAKPSQLHGSGGCRKDDAQCAPPSTES